MTPYTQNRYAYVENNPINRWDPLGYWEDGVNALISLARGDKVGAAMSAAAMIPLAGAAATGGKLIKKGVQALGPVVVPVVASSAKKVISTVASVAAPIAKIDSQLFGNKAVNEYITISHNIDFNKPGVYVVELKRHNTSCKFPIQVIDRKLE